MGRRLVALFQCLRILAARRAAVSLADLVPDPGMPRDANGWATAKWGHIMADTGQITFFCQTHPKPQDSVSFGENSPRVRAFH